MRDKSHIDQVERWANFVRDNPTKWKKIHTELIDSQIMKARQFVDKLAETDEGKKRIIEAYGIGNKNIYRKLLTSS
ncbi:MAG: hypothetical protein V1870_04030 [Candidatus Aenigmatarchaeota archaeon]